MTRRGNIFARRSLYEEGGDLLGRPPLFNADEEERTSE